MNISLVNIDYEAGPDSKKLFSLKALGILFFLSRYYSYTEFYVKSFLLVNYKCLSGN